MVKVTIVQHDPFGPGTQRVVTLWTKDPKGLVERKSRAYNMDRTTIQVG